MKEAYLWVKVYAIEGDELVEKPTGRGTNEPDLDSPWAVWSSLADRANAQKLRLPTEGCGDGVPVTMHGGRPPFMAAGSINGTSMSWGLDKDFNGVRGKHLAVAMHAINEGGRKEALKWLVGSIGKAWSADAMTYFLVVLAPEKICPKYPENDEDWAELLTCLKDYVDSDIAGAITSSPLLQGPDPLQPEEFQQFTDDMLVRRWHKKEFSAQDRYEQDAVWPVQQVVGAIDHPPKVLSKLMVGLVLDATSYAVFLYKYHYREARLRPYDLLPAAGGPIPVDSDVRKPWHPTYPGGHAAMAYALAYLYADKAMFPDLRFKLLDQAKVVARNREIAGLHYKSDSAAGNHLAQAVVNLMLNNPKFKALVDAAKLEW